MRKIKNFIYLDVDKMYSISSQIFEGMTEYILNTTSEKTGEKDQQKGKIGSGRVMADIIEKEKNETEKKFLHDYSYNLFEDELLRNEKVLEISPANIFDQVTKIDEYRFVKITSRIAFNDTKLIEDTISTFNDLGLSVTFLTKGGSMYPSEEEIKQALDSIKDRNERSKTKGKIISSLPNLKKIAAENNLYLNEEYLERLKFMINYGYSGQFEVAVPFSDGEEHCLFSSILRRDMLKENEVNIIRKYGRLSEKEFTIFGILTQTKSVKEGLQLYQDKNGDEGNVGMKEAVMNIIFHLSNMESTFSGKLNYEYIIDPIAVYQEL